MSSARDPQLETYRAKIPGAEHFKHLIPCQRACPVHTDTRGYIRAIAQGDLKKAYLIARAPNPLASICGRVCGAPCEANCRRATLNEAVSIRALKRFASEGGRANEAVVLKEFIAQLELEPTISDCADREDVHSLLPLLSNPAAPRGHGEKVAIIGSGPAGLAAAHDLALLGFSPVIFELCEKPGGMLAVGIPDYRLPRQIIEAEIEAIVKLGVTINCGVEVGKDRSFGGIREEHAATIICVGARSSRKLPIEGAGARGVFGGVEFLRDIALGRSVEIGNKVVVIGGGNVAYDVGRKALRQIATDTARTARNVVGIGGSVTLCSLESLEEMPADRTEIMEGEEEGIVRRSSLGPMKMIVGEDGAVNAVRFKKCLSVFDENRRFAPVFDENVREDIPCDTVLIAIGQSIDLSFVDPEGDGIPLNTRGLIECDKESLVTAQEDVFMAGDAAHGTRLLIDAVASGKKAARSVFRFLTGYEIGFEQTLFFGKGESPERPADFDFRARVPVPTASMKERFADTAAPCEANFNSDMANREAARCFDCGLNTVFDGSKCILCGGCVDVCPEACLKIVSLQQIHGDEPVEELREQNAGAAMSVILKNDERCTRCGLCVVRCPAGAIGLERLHFQSSCTWRKTR